MPRSVMETRGTGPSPPFRGEREGPSPQGWEGEVGGAANRVVGPPHPALSPRPAGGEGETLSGCPLFKPGQALGPRFRGRDG